MSYYKKSINIITKFLIDTSNTFKMDMGKINVDAQNKISERKEIQKQLLLLNKKKWMIYVPFYGKSYLKKIEEHEEKFQLITDILVSLKNKKNDLTQKKQKTFLQYNSVKEFYENNKEMKDDSLFETFYQNLNHVYRTTEWSLDKKIEIVSQIIEKITSLGTNINSFHSQIPKQEIIVKDKHKIWIPVSNNHRFEIQKLGAYIDQNVEKGSRFWIPINDKELRKKFEKYLPLKYKRIKERLSFPPIRHNAVGQNLWSIFDKESWSYIRKTYYEQAGYRCQLCGKQKGFLYKKLETEENYNSKGHVDCHEMWEWEILDSSQKVGIQKLQKMMIVCKDCHFMFHEGWAKKMAETKGLSEENVEKVIEYINLLRCETNGYVMKDLEKQLIRDSKLWDSNKHIETWFMDLSHLGNQDFMSNITPTLISDNKAGVTKDMIAGIDFQLENEERVAKKEIYEITAEYRNKNDRKI